MQGDHVRAVVMMVSQHAVTNHRRDSTYLRNSIRASSPPPRTGECNHPKTHNEYLTTLQTIDVPISTKSTHVPIS